MRTRPNAMGLKISLIVMLLLGSLILSGCQTGTSTVPKGWSSGTLSDNNTLIIGSMRGRLVALNIDDGSQLWAVTLVAPEPAGNILGCSQGSAPKVAIYGSPAVDGDLVVYVGGYDGRVYAISSSTRLSRVQYLRKNANAAPRPIVGSPSVSQGAVYIASSDGLVYALDTISLNERWQFETGGKIWSTPAVNGDTLYIGSFDKKFYAIDTATGREKWQFPTGGAIVAAAAVDNNTVYFSSFDQHLYAVDATDGHLKWQFPASDRDTKPGNWFWAKPIVYNGVVYAPCLDGKVYTLDAGNGAKLGEFDLGSPVSSSPVLADKSIIVVTQDGVVYSLETGNSQPRRLAELGESVAASLVAGQGKIYIHTLADAVYEIDARSGAKRQFNIE